MSGKILVPTDGSHRSKKAVAKAFELAKLMNAGITVLHVTPNVSPLLINPYTGPASHSFKEIIDEYERNGTEILNQTKLDYSTSGVKTTTKMLRGDPSVEIIKEAKEGGYDFIVMANRGLSEIKEFLMGSVSSRVVKHAECTVMIVK